MQLSTNLKRILLLVFLSFAFFIAGNSIINLTNPDEVFYAQTAKEMMQQRTWMVPYLFDQPQFEKPILAYWLLKIGFLMFGISNFGARFFPAVFGLVGVIAVYVLALRVYNDSKKAFICSLILVSSAFYLCFARFVFTDTIFSVFILLSLASFFLGYVDTKRKASGIIFSFIFSGLAVLTKGPLGFIIPFSIILLFLGFRKELKFILNKYAMWGFVLFILVSFPWYIFMIKKFGPNFTHEFFYNDHIRRLFEAEHLGYDRWYFYPASIIWGMFPWSIWVAAALVHLFKRTVAKKPEPFYQFLASWLLVVFIIFQIAHSKLVSYILPLFPALALIAGDFIYSMISANRTRLMRVLASISWFTIMTAVTAVAIGAAKYPQYLGSKVIIYGYLVLSAILLAVMLAFIIKRKFLAKIYLSTLQIPLLLFFALFSSNKFDAYVSSKSACEYLLKTEKVENTILCSKLLVRGVRYYTDKKVALINLGGKNLFSPHPIVNLCSDEEVKRFLKSQNITYCILNRSVSADIQRIAGNEFKAQLLKHIGNRYIIKISEK